MLRVPSKLLEFPHMGRMWLPLLLLGIMGTLKTSGMSTYREDLQHYCSWTVRVRSKAAEFRHTRRMWSNIWITYISRYISRYISLLDVPDQKSTLCQADNTRSEPLLLQCTVLWHRVTGLRLHGMTSSLVCKLGWPFTLNHPTDMVHIFTYYLAWTLESQISIVGPDFHLRQSQKCLLDRFVVCL